MIDSVWSRAPSEVKEAYGIEYLQESHIRMRKFLEQIGSDRVELVVDDYYHALTSRFPRPRYQVGNDSKFV